MRLAVAMLLVQVAIAEWLFNSLFWQLGEWLYTHFQFDPYRLKLPEILYLTGVGRLILLLIAVWIITRGLRGLWTIAGGWLIFNVLLVSVIRDILNCINWLWSSQSGKKLVVSDPLQPHFSFLNTWMWYGLWLLMIIAGAAIARELNMRYEQRLVKTRRVRTMLVIGLIAWVFQALNMKFGDVFLGWLLESIVSDFDNIVGLVNVSTGYGLAVHFFPAAIVCVLLFTTLNRARRALRLRYPPPCPDCGQVLVEGTADRCTECNWRS